MKHILVALLITLSCGCRQEQERKLDLGITAQEIASVLHMQKWTIKMPLDLPENKRLGIQLVINNSEKHPLIRLPSSPGANTTLIIWENDDPRLYNYNATGLNGYGWFGTLDNDAFIGTGTTMGLNSKTVCTVGDTIMEFSSPSTNSYKINICLVDYVD